jgi:hypothetical protein
MTLFRTILAGAALTAPLPAAAAAQPVTGEAELAKLIEGRIAGTPVNCLPYRRLGNARIINGVGIVYRVGRTLYVNRPRSSPADLDPNDILVVNGFGSQLCSLDRIDLVDRNVGFWTGFVSLGEFVPYTRPKTR